MSPAAAHAGFKHYKFLLGNLLSPELIVITPDVTCTNRKALMTPGQHWAARYNYCWNINTAGTHHQGRCGFITTAKQYNTINRISTDRLLNVHACQVAVQHCRWLHKSLP